MFRLLSPYCYFSPLVLLFVYFPARSALPNQERCWVFFYCATSALCWPGIVTAFLSNLSHNPCDNQTKAWFWYWSLELVYYSHATRPCYPNPGPAPDNPAVSNLSFNDFGERKSLGFLHVNICSLIPKLDLLKSWVHTGNPDVLAISESWFKKRVSDLDIFIPGYDVFHLDRNTKGGGVAIFVKTTCIVLLYWLNLFLSYLNWFLSFCCHVLSTSFCPSLCTNSS